MLSTKVRNLLLGGAATVSATALAAFFAPGASATTGPTCTGGSHSACVQVIGSGDHVDRMNGWAHNGSGVNLTGDSFWNELYYVKSGPAGPNAKGHVFIENCAFSRFPVNGNSPNCTWIPTGSDNPVNTGYYCDALWQEFLSPALWNWKCVYVHP